MTRPFIALGPLLIGLAACMQQPPAVTGSGPDAATPLQERLAGTRLDLTAQDDATAKMVMLLRADGTSQTEMSGIVLTGNWQARNQTLCQTDLRFDGMPSADPTPRCVDVAVSGDRITLVGKEDDGSTSTFSGTVSPL